MKTIFDKATRDELINRINALDQTSTACWGKMNLFQMLKHCTLWDEMVQGKRHFKRAFLGRLFGKFPLKVLTANDKPLKRNIPTLAELKVKESIGNAIAEKMKWIALLEKYEKFSNSGFVHPFMGKMTNEEVGLLAYKHADHHLRQFGR